MVKAEETYKMEGRSGGSGKIKYSIERETQRTLDFEVYVHAYSARNL